MRLPSTFALAAAWAVVALAACGGATAQVSVAVEQPIAFGHKQHVSYFSSGKHREEKLAMHLEFLGEEEAPEELQEGRCTECHEAGLADIGACAGCHRQFQDASLRARKDVRACAGCHGGTWTGHQAGIPSAAVCRACHGGEPRTGSAEEARLSTYLARREEPPWMQLTTVPDHVHFSHKAHVRYGGYSCTRCHEDMSVKDAPPLTATAFSMDGCVDCHEQNHAETDCLTCHQ